MLSGILRRNMTGWGGLRSKIVVKILEEFRDEIDSFIRSFQNIFVMCRNVDEVIGVSILDLLPDLL